MCRPVPPRSRRESGPLRNAAELGSAERGTRRAVESIKKLSSLLMSRVMMLDIGSLEDDIYNPVSIPYFTDFTYGLVLFLVKDVAPFDLCCFDGEAI